MKFRLLLVLAMMCNLYGKAQSLTIINKTPLDIHYKLTASLEICDKYCISNAVVKGNATSVIPKVDSVYWSCDKKPLHFSSFAVTGNKDVSSCGQRSTYTANSLVMPVAYSWAEDEKTRNVTVILQPAAGTVKK